MTFFGPDADVSSFFSMNEEENNDVGKKDNEVKKLVEGISHIESVSSVFLSSFVLPYYINHWNIVYFEIHSPPPEYSVLAS